LALKEVVGKDLQSGIAKPVARRIPEMAQFIRQQGTDVAMFQELWSDDNKERMASNLCGDYPYCFYVPAEIPIVSMIVMDDGLMVVSKTPFIKCAKITFTERMGEEKLAQKGALLCAVKDREGKPMLIVNTHLQSGTEIEAVKIRARQMRGIGLAVKDMISKVPELKNCRIVVGGDVNEPLAFIQDRGLMTERTSYLTQELNTAGIQVNNDQMVMQQARKLGVKEIVSINEQTKVGIVRDLDLKEKRRLDKTGEESRHVERNGSWPGWPNPEATDPNATQVLDHFFLDKQTRLKEYKVFRQEILGGTGALNGSDLPKAAISDHAALKVTLTRGN
jgi:endonuclease/exonuclease/phosphatase family metal-dependent hydrolase